MDLSFEFLLPKSSGFPGLGFEQKTFEWGGQEYPQEEISAGFGSNFILNVYPVAEHILKMIPINLKKIDWTSISVSGTGLDLYKESLTGLAEEEEGKTLKDLIITLLSTNDKWIVVFEPQSDRIDFTKEGKIEDVVESIESSFRYEQKGFLIWSAF